MQAQMTPQDQLHKLFLKAQGGDRVAFDDLVAGYRPRVEAWIESRIGEPLRRDLDAQDVMQETCLKAFRSLASLEWKGEAAFLGWLRGVAENHILSEARKRLRHNQVEIGPGIVGQGDPPSKSLRREERFDRLKEALDSLRPDYRQVILLARIRGMRVKEIAKEMGRSEAAVMQLLSRGVRKLRETFGEETESLHLPWRSLDDTGGGDE